MKNFIKTVKANLPTIVLSLFELLVGVLLFIRPVGFTTLILLIAGAVLAISGLILIIKYFRTEAVSAAKEQGLARGLLSLIAGAFFIINSQWLITTFPLLTVLYGVGILVMGVYKLQRTADMLRTKKKDWGWMAVGTVLALVFSVIILRNPFTSTAVLWYFTAASLCAESVADILFLIFHIKQEKA